MVLESQLGEPEMAHYAHEFVHLKSLKDLNLHGMCVSSTSSPVHSTRPSARVGSYRQLAEFGRIEAFGLWFAKSHQFNTFELAQYVSLVCLLNQGT